MNPRPTGPKPVALPNCATPRYVYLFGRGSRTRTHGTWFWRPLLYQLSYTPIMAEKMGFEPMQPLTNPNDLANRPLQPLEYFSRHVYPAFYFKWRRGWDSNPRSLSESLVFKTSSLNHSDTSPLWILQENLVTHRRFELRTP